MTDMLCQNCGKATATTHIHTVINGVSKTKHLCEHCAANENFTGVSQNSLANMFSSMFGELMSTGAVSRQKRCDSCGTAFSGIASNGKAGCPKCYRVFYNELLPYIKRVHGSTAHIGKHPIADNQPTAMVKVENKKEMKIDELKQQLKLHIEKEEYELAAKVRDEIKMLEQGEV